MRAADDHAGPVIARRMCRRGFGDGMAADQGDYGASLQCVGQAQQVLVGEHATEQGNAPRQAVLHCAGGHRNGGIVEHVHEVGVIAQIRVALDRFGVQLVQGDRSRVGRREDAVDPSHDAVADGLELLQPILRAKQLNCGGAGRLFQDSLDHRQHGVRLLLDQLAGDAVTFCDPGPLIQQARCFKERLEIDLDWLATKRL